MNSTYMKALRSDAQFQAVLKVLKERRPPVPVYDPKTDNVREVVHGLARAYGYDLAVSQLESM